MAEPKLIKFTYRELAELMIRQQNIKTGLWGVYMRFGVGGANVETAPDAASPAAIVPVLEVGLQQFDAPGPLAVDAASVWTK